MICDRCNENVEVLDIKNILSEESICVNCALKLVDLTEMAIRHYCSDFKKFESSLIEYKAELLHYSESVKWAEQRRDESRKKLNIYKERLEKVKIFTERNTDDKYN